MVSGKANKRKETELLADFLRDVFDIDEFNGELFKPDAALDALAVPDDVCHGFKKLADY